jgi:hypothetical protein
MNRQITDLTNILARKKACHKAILPYINNIRNQHKQFERLLSIHPFLWFLFGIIGSTGFVNGIINNPMNPLNFFFGFNDYGAPIIVVVTVSHLQASFCEEIDKAIDVVENSESMSIADQMLLHRDLTSLKSLTHTGLSYFTLDKSFVMSYAGSVLTFAALISGFSKGID